MHIIFVISAVHQESMCRVMTAIIKNVFIVNARQHPMTPRSLFTGHSKHSKDLV